MNAVESVGQYDVLLENPSIRRRWDGLDEGTFAYWSNSSTYVSPGDSLPSPYADFKARDVEVSIEPDGYELRATAVGILGTKGNRNVSSSLTRVSEGFDEASETWLVSDRSTFAIGLQSSLISGMYVTDITWEILDPSFDYCRCNVKFKGINGSRDQKIHLSTAAREMGIENIAVNLPGGWTDPRSGDVLWPRPEVRASFVQIGTPIMSDIPSASAPPVDPGVFQPTLTGDLKWHWPNGWVITAREAENLVGTNVWFVQETYIYNAEATF